jgi:probable rRNA maturation factor
MPEVDVQQACTGVEVPADEEFHRWCSVALGDANAAVVIRIVDRSESAELNERYRNKPGPTNVLSFPFQAPPGFNTPLIGDVVICGPVVIDEANVQGKAPEAHWAHLTVHGVLHLQGFDHEAADEAALMEAEEIAILERLGYANPYEEPADL